MQGHYSDKESIKSNQAKRRPRTLGAYYEMPEVKQKNILKQQEIFKFIRLRASTKERIDRDKAPGQRYDGFFRQLLDLWEKKEN